MSASAIERHELARANWLLHNSGSGIPLSDQRMSNELRKAAAEKDRVKAGAAQSAHHTATIKPVVTRWIAAGEDQADRGGRTLIALAMFVPAVIAVAPMLAVSKTLYMVSTESLLRKEKDGVQAIPRMKPWLLAGIGAVLVAAVAVGFLPVRVIQPWPWEVTYVLGSMLALYVLWQLALGVLLTAWQVRRHGWPGVNLKTTADTTGFLPMDAEAGYVPADDEPTKPALAEERVEVEGFALDDDFEDWMTKDENEIDFEDGSK